MRAWPDSDKTAWFPPWKKPVRSGVYEVEWGFDPKITVDQGFAFYDVEQKLWGWTARRAEDVLRQGSGGANQRKMWRGLREGALIKATEGMQS